MGAGGAPGTAHSNIMRAVALSKGIPLSLASSSHDDIRLLARSAAFAMSLGAKELFHTNFLAFVLESDEPSLVPAQRAIRCALGFDPGEGAISRCAVWREKNNLDLVLVELRAAPTEAAGEAAVPGAQDVRSWNWSAEGRWQRSGRGVVPAPSGGATCDVPSGRVLLVEAKLKSIPQAEQLIEYDQKLARSGITLAYPEDAVKPEWEFCIGRRGERRTSARNARMPTFVIERRLLSVTGISLADHWHGVSWASLYQAMNARLPTLAGTPMEATMRDYVEVLGALVRLLDRVRRMCVDAHPASGDGPTYGALRAQVLDPRIRALRIHDLLGKALFDCWLNHDIRPQVTTPVPPGWSLNTYVNYSRGVPGLGVELVNPHFATPGGGALDLRIGVQVQSCELRLFADARKGWPGLERWIVEDTRLLADWFGTPVFGRLPVGTDGRAFGVPTRPGRATNLKIFDVQRFVYSKVDIDDRGVAEVERELARLVAVAAGLVAML